MTLLEFLGIARDRGFLGPGDVAFHVEHAHRYLAALPETTSLVLDLGSGAGLPGLVVAQQRPDVEVALLEASEKRCQFLEEAIVGLGLASTTVVRGRAEVVGRDPRWRGQVDVVVTRSFGAPAVTAECATPFLRPDGVLVVSEPRSAEGRWPEGSVGVLGLRKGPVIGDEVAALQVLIQESPCPDEFPRADGVPRKRPLF